MLVTKRIRGLLRGMLLGAFLLPLAAGGQSMSGVKIYVNPGHGGYNSDDRNMPVPPFALGDTAGFWESKSNLAKGLHLRGLLEAEGARVIMSRVQNRTIDDRPLSAIAAEANTNQVDFMISIHSNGFNSATNYVLMLYHGWDGNPILPQSLALANLFWDNLFSNQTTHWTSRSRQVRGDKSFAPADWNGYGVLRPLTVPGLISEGSFHDYTPETYRLLNEQYKQLEAWHFFKAFCQYYGGNPGRKGKIAGFVKDNYRKVTAYPVVANSTDQWLPVNGARVTLEPGNLQVTADQLNNGFYMFDNLLPGKYSLRFEADKYEPLQVNDIQVDSAKVTYHLCYLNQDRSDPLKVEDYSPKPGTGGVVPASSDVVFYFNFEIDTLSLVEAFSIKPAVSGRFIYENQGRTARFVHDAPFDVSTTYTVALRKSARHIGKLAMEEDFSFSFTTAVRNRLLLVNHYPKDGMGGVWPETQVRLHFDGRLVNDALASRIRITDTRGNTVSRTGVELNTYPGTVGSYAFLLNGLTPDSTYILKVDGGLYDEEGLRLTDDLEIRFRVKPVFVSPLVAAFEFEESAATWSVDTLQSRNLDPGNNNRILRYNDSKLFGSYSWRLLYSFTSPDARVVVRPLAPLFVVRSGQYLGLYLWGDLSDDRLFLLFNREGSEVKVPLATIDFAGWQFREVRLEFPESDVGYAFNGFRLESAGTPFSGKGVLFFDNLIVGDQAITGNNPLLLAGRKSLEVYPNPAGEKLNFAISAKDGLCTYQVTSLGGKTLREGKIGLAAGKGSISLGGMAPGTYILRILHDEGMGYALFIRQ